MGFSDIDCIREGGIDNPIDAGASEIIIKCIRQTPSSPSLIIYGDNAVGRSLEELETSGCLFNRKQGNDDKIGRFGMGANVGSSQLTRLKGKTTRLSKIQGGLLNQITLDYPTTIRSGNYNIYAHEASKTYEDMWDKYAINKEHGSLEILECPDSVVAEIIEKFHLEKENLSRMYADYLEKGIKIAFKVNDEVPINLIAINVSDKKMLRILKHMNYQYLKNESNNVIIEFTNGRQQLVYKDKIGGNQKTGALSKLGYMNIGKITGTSTYNENWKKDNNGGYYLKRVNKIVDRFIIESRNKDDFGKRDVIAASSVT